MDVKNDGNHLRALRRILADRNGTIRTAHLAKFGIPRTYLSILEKKGEIERVSRGIYRAKSALPTLAMEDEMAGFQSKYSGSIYSHETALYLHDLTDRNPLYYSITVPSGYHSEALNGGPHKIYYVKRALLSLGVETMPSHQGNIIRVTGLERTICDILRSRNQMDVQLVNEAVKRYVKNPRKNLHLLNQYAGPFGVQKVVRTYIEILL